MTIADINPDAAQRLQSLRQSLRGDMRQRELDRQLAARALAETARRHRVGTGLARMRHARRPKVALA